MSLFYVDRRLDQMFCSFKLFQEVDLREFRVAVILREELVQNVLESDGLRPEIRAW